MATSRILSTRTLLTCAAIGVATGLLGGIAGWLTPLVIVAVPFIYGLILGVHVLPGIIAQETLRLPWVALLTHLIAALVSSAMAPQWTLRFLGTALMFAVIQEIVAATTRYRVWAAWRYFVSAIIIGIIVAAAVWFAVHLSSFALWLQVAYLAISVLGPVIWTAIGLWIGHELRRAGVARTTTSR